MLIDKKKNKKGYTIQCIVFAMVGFFALPLIPTFGGSWPIVTHLPVMFFVLINIKNAIEVNAPKDAGDYNPDVGDEPEDSGYKPD